jgi:hypothetical protein
MDFKEAGYTPKNLKCLLKKALPDLPRPRVYLAAELGVGVDAVDHWCVDTESKRHVDMPLKKWRKALKLLERCEVMSNEHDEIIKIKMSQEAIGNAVYLADELDISKTAAVESAINMLAELCRNTAKGQTWRVSRKNKQFNYAK